MNDRSLACPGCGHVMHVEVLSKVEVDRCERCGGTWFDVGEVARAALCEVPPIALRGPSPRTCPRGGNELALGRLDDVEVDHCEGCLGVYLDAGELERLRAREGVDAVEPPTTPDHTMEPPAAQEMRLWGLFVGGTSA